MKYKDNNGSWQTIKVKNYGIEQTPIGSMIYYPSQNIPAGYLVCDGSEKLIADYPLLFNAIGYIGGEDVDTGYFRLPDMRGVVPGGYNSTLSSGNPMYGQFGDQVGAPTHTLTIDEMPSHDHSPTEAGHEARVGGWAWKNGVKDLFALTTQDYWASGYPIETLSSEGGNQPHSIVQPTKLYHWLIKAKNVVTLGGYTEDFEVRGNLTVNTINGQKTYLDVKLNTEIATNEYIDGKRVYIKQLEFTDTLVGGNSFTKAHGITGASRIWIDTANSYMINIVGKTVPLPCTCYDGNFSDRVSLSINGDNIILWNDTGWGETWTKVIRLKYTKTK